MLSLRREEDHLWKLISVQSRFETSVFLESYSRHILSLFLREEYSVKFRLTSPTVQPSSNSFSFSLFLSLFLRSLSSRLFIPSCSSISLLASAPPEVGPSPTTVDNSNQRSEGGKYKNWNFGDFYVKAELFILSTLRLLICPKPPNLETTSPFFSEPREIHLSVTGWTTIMCCLFFCENERLVVGGECCHQGGIIFNIFPT